MKRGQKVLIYDCRSQTIKKVASKDLTIWAPELFIYVIETDIEVLNDVMKYRYKLGSVEKLDYWTTGLEFTKSRVSFKTRESAFLESHGLTYENVLSVERYWYLNKEQISKYLESN